MLKRIFSEPLVHFLLLGSAMLLGVAFFGSGSGAPGGAIGSSPSAAAEATTIRVEQTALRDFVRSRTGTPDRTRFAEQWAGLSEAARADWLDRFVREEALVREARALGLDRDDMLIRRRLVQQMEFLAVGAEGAAPEPRPAELEAFFGERADEYRIPGTLRFAHVFLAEDAGAQRFSAAERLRDALNARKATDQDALSEGDRFLYQRIYVDRTRAEVESHFGAAMTAQLIALEPSASRWQGPIESEHGLHLVLLSRWVPDRLPPLAEIESQVLADWRRERRERIREEAIDEIVAKYRIETRP